MTTAETLFAPFSAFRALIASNTTAARLASALETLTPEALEAEALAGGVDLVDHLEAVVDALDTARTAFRGAPETLDARIAFRRKASALETWAGDIEAFRRVEASTVRRLSDELAAAQAGLSEAVELHQRYQDAISEGRVAIARRRVIALKQDLADWTR